MGKTWLFDSIKECEKRLLEAFGHSSDFLVQSVPTLHGKAVIAYIDGIVSRDFLDRDIIRALTSQLFEGNLSRLPTATEPAPDFDETLMQVASGKALAVLEGSPDAVLCDIKFIEKRAVAEPEAESVIRGPKEGFTENLRTNTSLLRRKIASPKLVFENMVLGRQTRTNVSIAYVSGIVNRDVLREVKKRLKVILTDAVLESGQIEQLIDHNRYSTVSGIGLTQKPDIAALRILEGRVAVLCDGTPHVLTIPELFLENLYASEDYYNRTVYVIMMRLLRIAGFFISVLLPGLMLAVVTYSPEMMPPVFLASVISATQSKPLPLGAELFFLMLMFELLKESGTRLPRTIGSAVSIVGALIIGESAVSAGIVSAPTVIIVALTAVCSFIVSNLASFCTFYRWVLLFLGGIAGLPGIAFGVFFIVAQLASKQSFGVPILANLKRGDLSDFLIRLPFKRMKTRPSAIAEDNKTRRDFKSRAEIQAEKKAKYE